MSQSLDTILKSIIASADSTKDALALLESKLESPEFPELVHDLMSKTGQTVPEGVSLLDLKNNAMLSYINNIALVVLARLEAMKTNDTTKINLVKTKAVQGSITQRVVMERGIKGLEKKLQYQLDKMVRNYNKMEKDSSADSVEKKLKQGEKGQAGSDEEDDEDEDSEAEDELNYRPDASALVESMKTKESKEKEDAEEEGASGKSEKYRPPKISAALPPQEFREASNKSKNTAKLQSMEEYLMETGDAPMAEASIGSTIINNGRGGVKTLKDRQKEEEIKRYEESNFTRLSTNMSKKDKMSQKRRQQNTFFGEDWGIFNNKRDDIGTSSKRSKPKSAWDRAKKRRTE